MSIEQELLRFAVVVFLQRRNQHSTRDPDLLHERRYLVKRLSGIALLIALALPASAQTAGPSMMAPTGREEFRQRAMMSDAFEIASSRLALERSRNARVRSYAQQMIADHRSTSEALNGGTAVYSPTGDIVGNSVTGGLVGAGVGALVGGPVGAAVGAGIGAAAGVTTGAASRGGTSASQAGVALDSNQSATLQQLAAARGPRFDRLYGRAQRVAHQEALALYTSYARSGQDPSMVAFARSVVPHLKQHYEVARRLPGGR
jgi:predicted outer membrane protein